ncbi:hypothetical protein ZWY2020_056220 [Hordeum vulgare]|nr:hypothetical protein ZWY2020_056220 [Hordeum vulgare]
MVALEEYPPPPAPDDDDDDMVATTTVAIATPSPKNVSLFNAPNNNHIAKCLMAKCIDQLTPNIKTNITTSPSLLNCVDDSDVVELDEHDLDKFLCTIKGQPKKHFLALLEQLGEANDLIESHEETISELQGHSHDYADEIVELSIALEKERTLRLALEESYNDDCAKLQKELHHVIVLTRMLKSEKDTLGVGHDRLKVEFDTLDKAHKVLKGAHFSLKESHDQLQAKLTEDISTCPPFVIIDNACPTNPCCEHVHLVEENAKLKDKLEKGLVSGIQGEKNLNGILSNQKDVVGKEGLGLTSKSKRKRKNRNKQSPTLMDIFVKEGEGTQESLYDEVKDDIAPVEIEPIDVTIQLANRDTICPVGIVRDVEVLCGKMKYPADFLVLATTQDSFCPIIFGRPFLNTVNAHIDCEKQIVTVGFEGVSHEFNFSKFGRQPHEKDLPSRHETIALASIVVPPTDPLEQYLLEHENDMHMDERDEIDRVVLEQYPILKNNLPVKLLGDPPPPKGDPVFELKQLSDTLKYAYLYEKEIYHVIISAILSEHEEKKLLKTLRKHRAAIGYTLDDLKGISPTLCQHKIKTDP